MTEKIYIVAAVGWQYNDEGYETSWDGASYEDVSRSFRNREDAEQEVLDKTVAFLEQTVKHEWRGLISFSQEESYIGDVDVEWLQQLFPEHDYEDDWDMTIPKDATEEQLQVIAEKLGNVFYEVVESQLR